MSTTTPAPLVKERLDQNADGKVTRSEFIAGLDKDHDGLTTKKEAEDLDHDGKVEKKEKELLDRDDDGKITRHEILNSPEADVNNDGVVTKQEIRKVYQPPPPPPLPLKRSPPPPAAISAHGGGHHGGAGSSSSSSSSSSGGAGTSSSGGGGGHGGHHGGGVASLAPPPPASRPKRVSWRYGYWDTFEDCFDEFVLVIMCAVTLHAAIKWVYNRLTNPKRGGKYKKVSKMNSFLDAYGPDPGVELAMSTTEGELPAAEGAADDPRDPEVAAGVRDATAEGISPAVVVVSAGASPRNSRDTETFPA